LKAIARSGDQGHVGVPSSSLAASVGAPVLDIDALYAEHAPFIARVLIRLVGDGPQVDDLLQETFFTAFRRRDSFDGRSNARTWLYGIASRLAMRYRRGTSRFKRFLGIFGGEPTDHATDRPDRHLERARAAALVRDVLERIPFKQREVFVLYELEELQGSEIAEMLEIPIGTVWTRLHHAREKFQTSMRRRMEREGRT
jgi:RNA polymerase sigma-70 factor (ECF subfamily)